MDLIAAFPSRVIGVLSYISSVSHGEAGVCYRKRVLLIG